MRATPPERVRLELGWTFEGGEVARRRAPAARRPGARARRPRRPDGRVLGARDRAVVGARSAPCSRPTSASARGHLASGGALELFAGLHPDVRWRDGALLVDRRRRGRGRARRPRAAARAGRVRLAARRRDVRPAVAAGADLPAARGRRPVGAGAPTTRRRSATCSAAGARASSPRSRAEATTTDLARRLAASPAGVSEHLGVLRRAGPRARPPRGPLGALLAHGHRRRAHSPSVFPRISFMISSVPPPIGPSRASRAARARSCGVGVAEVGEQAVAGVLELEVRALREQLGHRHLAHGIAAVEEAAQRVVGQRGAALGRHRELGDAVAHALRARRARRGSRSRARASRASSRPRRATSAAAPTGSWRRSGRSRGPPRRAARRRARRRPRTRSRRCRRRASRASPAAARSRPRPPR